MKKRIKLTIEYKGTSYNGWQRQKNANSIQGLIEDALRQLVGQDIAIHGAGRTDAGVHAYAMVAHFDTDSPIPPEKYAYTLNKLLPSDIRIKQSEEVSSTFHSRYSAKFKTYLYKIWCERTPRAIYHDTHYIINHDLDVNLMREGAKYLIGEHDFKTFMTSGSSAISTVRAITGVDIDCVQKDNGKEITINIRGNGFLYNMVRVIAAQLVKVGLKKIEPTRIKELIELKNRKYARETAPSQGLYLSHIEY